MGDIDDKYLFSGVAGINENRAMPATCDNSQGPVTEPKDKDISTDPNGKCNNDNDIKDIDNDNISSSKVHFCHANRGIFDSRGDNDNASISVTDWNASVAASTVIPEYSHPVRMDDNGILQHYVDVPASKVIEFKALLKVKRTIVEGMLHRAKLPLRAGIFDQGDTHYDLIVRLLRFVAGRDPATKDVGLFPMGYAFKSRAGPTNNSSDDSFP